MVDYEEEIKKRTQMVYVPNWFSVDIKTGVSVNPLLLAQTHRYKPQISLCFVILCLLQHLRNYSDIQ